MVHESADQGHTLELRPPAGAETSVDPITVPDILGGSADLRHTAISTATVNIPPRTGLVGYALGEGVLRYDGERLFTGYEVRTLPGPSSGDTQTIELRGPAAAIDGGDVHLSVLNRAAHDVIRDVWAEYTPFTFTVHDPAPGNETYLGTGTDDDGNPVPFETEGTVLSVLQDLHRRAGMRFTVRHDIGTTATPVVESYVPGELVRAAEWTRLDHNSEFVPGEYANTVTVYGRKREGQPRPQWTARDYDEIEQYGVYPRPDGVPIWDPELTSSEDCREEAISILADRVDEISLSGEVDIVPQLIHPGYHRPVPAFDAILDGGSLPLDKVSISLLGDEPTATLEFAATDTVADKLVKTARTAQTASRLH